MDIEKEEDNLYSNIEAGVTHLIVYKEIYKQGLVAEFGWVSDTEFFIWVPHYFFEHFIKELGDILGVSVFHPNGFNVRVLEDTVCLNLCDIAEEYFDVEKLFPKEEYRH